MTALLILGVIAYAPHFTTAALPEAGGCLLGGFWPTWFLSTVAAGLSGPISFITLLGDCTRYISPTRYSSRRVLHATWLGLILGLLVPQLFGTFTAFGARAALDHAGPLVDASPTWHLIPLLSGRSTGPCRKRPGSTPPTAVPRPPVREASERRTGNGRRGAGDGR